MPDAIKRRRPSLEHGEARHARAVHNHQHQQRQYEGGHLDRRQATTSPHTTRRPASTPAASVITLSISGRITTVTLDPGDSPPPAPSRGARGSSSNAASTGRSRSSTAPTSISPVVASSNVGAQASATPSDANYNPNGGPPRLTTGQTYGVIAGGIGIGVLILGMLVFWCYRRRKEKADEKGWWKLQDGQHDEMKDDKDGKNGRMMGQRGGAGNTGRVSPYRERGDIGGSDVDISAPVLQRAPSSNARLGPWSAENRARDLGGSSGRDTPTRPLRPSQLIEHERKQREELLAMPTRPSPSASKITQWSNTTLVDSSTPRMGLGINQQQHQQSPYLTKSSNPTTPRMDSVAGGQDESLASLETLTEGAQYPPTRMRQPPARMESRENIDQGLAAKTDTIWGLADSYTDRGEVDRNPKYAPRGDSRQPNYNERDTSSSFDSTPRGSGSAKGTSETSNTSYADPPSAKPPAAAVVPTRLPRSDSIRRPAAQTQQVPSPHIAAPPPMPPLSSSPPSAINQVRAALQQSELTSPTASTIMSASSPNTTLRSPALHVDLRHDDFRLPSDLQELARFASEPSPDLGRSKSPLPFLSDVTLERKASNATLRAADAFAPTSRPYEPQVRNATSPLAVVTRGLPFGAQPASASASVENAPARSPIAGVQVGGRRPDPSAQVQGQGQNGVQLGRKVSISRDPLGPVRLSREDSLKMRFGGSSPDARTSPSPLDSHKVGHSHVRSPSTELEEIDSFGGGHRQSDAPNGTEGDRTGDRDTLKRYDDLFELEAAARSSTSSVPQHESFFTPLTFDVPQTKPLSFSANTSTAGSGPPTPTTPAFQVNGNGVKQPMVVVAEASPRSESTITLHAPPPQTQALRTKGLQAPQSASPSADGFMPLGQMNLAVQQPNYRSATESIYGLYD